ncbi:hypothetical protein GCM10022293_52800 [Azospirillum formosense]
MTEAAAQVRPPRGAVSRIASNWAPIARSDSLGFARAMPATSGQRDKCQLNNAAIINQTQ